MSHVISQIIEDNRHHNASFLDTGLAVTHKRIDGYVLSPFDASFLQVKSSYTAGPALHIFAIEIITQLVGCEVTGAAIER